MDKVRLQHIIGLLLLMCSAGCLNEVSLTPDTDEGLDKVVIMGKLTLGDTSSVLVRVTQFRPRDLFSTADPIAVDEVILFNQDDESVSVPANVSRSGFYAEFPEYDANFAIIPGNAYGLEVTLRDGRIYRSALDTLFAVPNIVDIDFELDRVLRSDVNGNTLEGDVITYSVLTSSRLPDGSGVANLLWNMSSTFKLTEKEEGEINPDTCYLSFYVRNGNLPLFPGRLAGGNPETVINEPIYQEAVNFYYAEGYQFFLTQESLSNQATAYWQEVQQLLNREGTIAEDPPGLTIGNFSSLDDPSEEVVGLFYAVEQTKSDIFIHPNDVGDLSNFCPIIIDDPEVASQINICDDCVFVWGKNSTKIKPSNWGG